MGDRAAFPDHVEVIVFHIKLDHPDAPGVLDWESLSQVFARPQFAGVCSRVCCHNHKKSATNFIKEKLSTYDSRGILHITRPMTGSPGRNSHRSASIF